MTAQLSSSSQHQPYTVSLPAMSLPDWNALLPALRPATRIVLHAPSPQALIRARGNFKNLKATHPGLEVWIVVNAQAVQAVLDEPHEMGPALTQVLLCPNTLRNNGLHAPAHIQVLPMGAVEAIARMQQDGWIYIRS
ncbi:MULTISPECIES: hypothetical protein [Comamonas]|nr:MULTISPECIES: hypothetical protein [Comamonas]MEB5967125.1 hypothetical protein [Comamonas testosteroni]